MWKDRKILINERERAYCRYIEKDKEYPNIIYVQTPLLSVSGLSQKVYEPLANYNYNVYALDLLDIGKSDGKVQLFTIERMIKSINGLIDYIEKQSDQPVFLYASTGIGGICGQYFVAQSNRISGFAQYGVGIYQNLKPMRMSLYLVKGLSKIIDVIARVSPTFSMKLKPPKYKGKNKNLDDSVYKIALEEKEDLFSANIMWVKALVEMFVAKDSKLKEKLKCPTLVFKLTSDRYFSPEYFDEYYDRLDCEKKLYTIEDIHNSYYYRAEEICLEVTHWFSQYTNREI